MKILIIDDNERLARRTKERLQKWYVIDTADSGETGLQMLSHSDYDLILLDLALPGINGDQVCMQIKSFWPDTAVLIVSGEDSTTSKVNLLGIGADDYITKPYEFRELHARIQAILRRSQATTYREKVVVGNLTLDPNDRTVMRNGIYITLRRKEFNILEYLCLNPGRILTREMIIHQAWPVESSVNWTSSVDVHIKQLRDKIDKPFDTPMIKTVYGLGYMIEVPSNLPTKQKEGEVK